MDELKQILDEPIQPVSEVEKEIEKQHLKEENRLKRNAYYRDYYQKNKDKYNKHTLGKGVGKRGKAKQTTYRLSILDEKSKSPIISQEFKSLKEIGETLKLSPTVISMINRGKYQFGMGKSKKTKRYGKFRIERIRN